MEMLQYIALENWIITRHRLCVYFNRIVEQLEMWAVNSAKLNLVHNLFIRNYKKNRDMLKIMTLVEGFNCYFVFSNVIIFNDT